MLCAAYVRKCDILLVHFVAQQQNKSSDNTEIALSFPDSFFLVREKMVEKMDDLIGYTRSISPNR